MIAVKRALIIGGGISGMCAAIELRKRGVQVDLVELDPHWRVYGAGITLSGPTLRAFARVGVVQDIMIHGCCADGLDAFTAGGQPIGQLPTPRIAGADIPGGGGILRPVLARILRERTLASGTAVRCGASFSSLEEATDSVRVNFSDSRSESYDLVVGADGLRSAVRDALFPDVPAPHYTGQGSWRAVVPRPAHLARAQMYMGRSVKAGINPVSKDEMYMFVTERRESPDHIDEALWAGELRGILKEFGGQIGEIRDGLGPQSQILYRPFYAVLVPPPWHKGRVVLIGDAVHATTPHLASGAGIGVEDAVVLAEELERSTDLELALGAFTQRRYERCRMVVENSLALGDMERSNAPREQHEQLMRSSMAALLAPI
jgi:2-polyprenyl-6-methoxyphenol hydroxylase-like FAD-dependent oxidoreductase